MKSGTKTDNLTKNKTQNQKVVTIPSSIHSIEYEAFREQNEIEEVILPDTIQNISFKAFYKFQGIVHKQSDFSLNLDFKNKKIGDTLLFGKYPQTQLGDVLPIEWKIIDETDSHFLLISSICLDCQQYYTEWEIVSWKNSSIRYWLNHIFHNYAFSEKEKKKIKQTSLHNKQSLKIKDNTDTNDSVFLLNKDEVLYYFPKPEDRIANPSSHVIIKGMDDYHTACWWWLRNPGDKMEYVAIGTNGKIYEFSIYMTYYHGIRPCIWIEK